ncbi:ubiquitin-like protein 4A [Thrips palmi]|uniref:Ubiquitin-like protein 4A n=1 Tax=Thrips palmi TaxID=161013 RepID=A0A6P8YU43_THRPL|nr:ubiquitin-like protein 4A [Thrips palmi]
MKIHIKVLQGQECSMEVSSEMSVLELKEQVSTRLKIPVNQQKFLVSGKTLSDEKNLDHYGVKEGTKLILAVRKIDDGAPDVNHLRSAAYTFLRRFYSDPEARKIQEEFIKSFHKSVNSLSLDDLERIATMHINEVK